MNYNDLMKKPGKRINPKVYYFDGEDKITLEHDDLILAKPNFKSKLIGTVMRGLEVETTREIPNVPIYFENTVSYAGDSQTKTIGPYYLRSVEYNADSKTYSHEIYDEFMKTMIDYKPLKLSYPTTVIKFFLKLCEECGFETDITSLPNGNRVIQTDIYNGINFTYRDVFEDIGQATATLFGIENNKVIKISLGKNEVVLTDDELKNQNIETSGHFGPINSIILSRAGDSDRIYKRDESLTSWNEFKITDNQLMNDNNRSDYLPDLYDELYGIEYDIFDFELVGYGGFEVLQKIRVETGNNIYNSYVFNNEEEYTQGYTESIYTELPEETEMDYKTSDTTDRKINQTYMIVDKLNQQITALISQVVNLVETVHGTGNLEMTSNFDTTNFELKIKNACQDFPDPKDLDDDCPLGSWLRVTYADNSYNRYQLPPLALRQLDGVFDEMNIKSGKISVTKRIGIDEKEDLYLLDEEIVTNCDDVVIELHQGKNTIQLESFPYASFDMVYMTENIYTDSFATNATVQTLIQAEVGKFIAKVVSETEFQEIISQIEENIGNISISVEDVQKGLADKVSKNKAEILLALTNGQSSTTITSDLINLIGLITANGYFKILQDGSMEAVSGKFTGDVYLGAGKKVIGGDGLYSNLQYSSTGNFNGYSLIGFTTVFASGTGSSMVDFDYENLVLSFYIPDNFKIEHAYVTLLTTPINSFASGTDESGNYKNAIIGKPNHLRLYKPLQELTIPSLVYTFGGGEMFNNSSDFNLTEISSAFGSTDYNPSSTTPGKVDTKTSIDIGNQLKAGQLNTLVVRTSLAKPSSMPREWDMDYSSIAVNTGLGKMVLDIFGFMTTK